MVDLNAKIMDKITVICRICLGTKEEAILIAGDEGKGLHIDIILSKYFCFEFEVCDDEQKLFVQCLNNYIWLRSPNR